MKYILLILVMLSLSIFGQVKVLTVRGNVSTNGSQILNGSTLNLSDSINVEKQSYISITYNGKIVQYNSAGKYSIDKSFKSLVSTSLSKKYSDFVLSELSKKEPIDIHANYQRNMKVTGSIERAINTAAISVCLPKTSKIINKIGYITWGGKLSENYTIIGTNLFDEEVFNITSDLNTISLKDINFEMPSDRTIKLTIMSDSGSSNPYVIKFIDKKNELLFNKAAIDSEYSDSTALNSIIKALYYADMGLFVEADTEFKNAINSDDSVIEYKNMYMNFLTKEGLLEFYK